LGSGCNVLWPVSDRATLILNALSPVIF